VAAPDPRAPIGVFDSGLGGLTVVRAIAEALPDERLVYLGDTARVPYGTRSARTVVRYAKSCGRALAARGVKVLVVACNTVSAVALDALRVELDLPVLGVIEPGARAGVAATRSTDGAGARRLGVLATAGTVASGAYVRAAAAADSRVEVVAHAAPLLVPLVEEGWLDGEVPRLAVRRYLVPLVEAGVRALVLGCTHYPLLAPLIAEELRAMAGRQVPVVDGAFATAAELATLLDRRGLRVPSDAAAAHRGAVAPRDDGSEIGRRLELLVTDFPTRFAEVASRFLDLDVSALPVRAIDL
jgi:glutamate racemase